MEYLSANAWLAMMPKLEPTIPLIGQYDITKLVLALLIFLVLSLFFQILQKVILVRLEKLSRKTSTDIDNVIIKTVEGVRPWVYNIIAVYIALELFILPQFLDYIVTGAILFALVWQAIQVVGTILEFLINRLVQKDEDGDGEVDPNSVNASNLLVLISKIILWSLGILFVLSNLGIEITSLIAGLGIGGVAVAFALQGVLSDLFASFSIYFDKPFRIGDFVVIGQDSGVVQHIGVKSTRIRTLQGEELVVSNNELTTVRVQNFKKMEERRIVSQFGITYETPQERVQEVPGIVKRIFENLDAGRLDRVHFTDFGDSALIFELVYYVETSDYTQYLDIQQAFNFDLMQRFAELGIEFAYPTQTIYTKQIT